MRISRWLLLGVGLLTLAADQTAKYVVVSQLTGILDGSNGLPRVLSFFSPRRDSVLTGSASAAPMPSRSVRVGYVENAGSEWSLWSPLPEPVRKPFFFAASALALGFIGFMLWRLPMGQRAVRMGLALVLGGALGNFIDRALRGYVIDLFDVRWRAHPGLRWPTFNLADAAISVGVALVLFDLFQVRGAFRAVERPPPRPTLAPGKANF